MGLFVYHAQGLLYQKDLNRAGAKKAHTAMPQHVSLLNQQQGKTIPSLGCQPSVASALLALLISPGPRLIGKLILSL